jgi:putative oxidoreductase
MSIGRLAARAVIGGLFIGHGTQKLFGWFGGPGRAGTEAMMESLELRPATVTALTAGVTETVGGSLLAAGLATPVAAAALTGVMTTAISKVHWPNGPWAANGGWEYNVVLIATLAALVDTGPGNLSLDHLLGTERRGPGWALGALTLGVATAAATMAIGRRGTPAAPAAALADDAAVAAAHGETAGDPTTTDS